MKTVATVSLPVELWAQVEKEAGKLGMRNKSEYVNRAITDYMKRTVTKESKDEDKRDRGY